MDIKSEVESAIADLKKALEGTDTEAIKDATDKAAQASQKMGTAIYAQAQASTAEDTTGAGISPRPPRMTTRSSRPRSWTRTGTQEKVAPPDEFARGHQRRAGDP